MRQFYAAFFALCLLPGVLHAQDEKILAAEVNGVPISKEQLTKERRARLGELERELDSRASNRLLLERLIEKELLWQQAVRLKLLPSKDETSELLKSNTSEQATKLGIEMKSHGLTEEEYFQRVRRDFAVRRLLDAEVYNGIDASEDDLRREYAERKSHLASVEEVRLKEIFLPETSNSSGTSARALAEQIHSKLIGDNSQFGQYAKKFSQGAARENGGDLGYLTKNQLPDSYADAIFSLPTGSLSEVLAAADGFHVFLLVERRGGVTAPFETVAPRLRQELLQRRREEALKSYLDALRKTSKIIVYSQ